MAYDRMIYFNGKTVAPTQEALQLLCEDFLGGVGTIEYKDDRFILSLPGKPSHPYARIGGSTRVYQDERWIEVLQDPDSGDVDVLTRGQDAFTGALADALAKLIARWWKGSDPSQ